MFTSSKLFAPGQHILLLALLILLLGPTPGVASDPLRCEIRKITEKLRDYLAGRRVKEVAVGDVVSTDPTTPSSSGPGIRKLLIDELERAELKVKLRADVGLTISYRGRKLKHEKDRTRDVMAVELRFVVSFNQDNSQEDFGPFRIWNDEANRHLLGLTVNNTERGQAREQQTLVAFTKPEANLDGTLVLAGEKAPYGVEILVNGKPLIPTDEDGFGLVKLQRDQTYAIRLVNRSPLEMAVRLSVDGLNIFTFSELRHKEGPSKGEPLYDMVLIPPQGSVTIPGWQRNNTISHRFKITEYAETAAAKLNRITDIGTITATFCAAWEKTPPPDEPDGQRRVGDDGTGFGEATNQKYTAVRRTIGAVRASVAVRYKVPPSVQ